MNVGISGLGKLGTPVALTIESRGHSVTGYDVRQEPYDYLEGRAIPYQEEGLQPLLDTHCINLTHDIGTLVAQSDIIFLAVQTPHDPKYEGVTRLPDDRKDFDYTHLKQGVKDIAETAKELGKMTTLAVISTCLPGTFEREIRPLLNEYTSYGYNPLYIAMGTVKADYLDPEFNLIGVHDKEAAEKLEEFYATINGAPNVVTDVTTAEAIKVSYNTFITMKTVLGNAWGEIAHKLGANVDDIFKAWSLSGKRLLSERYLKAGVADGGSCHPRDNIALSWLAKEIGLSHNIFEDLMKAREDHMAWIAKEATLLSIKEKLPVVVLGRSFKPETNIETGSPSILMSNILNEYGVPHEHVEDLDTFAPAIYVIGTQHERYKDYPFPAGSTVLDPFGYLPDYPDVEVIRIGRNNGKMPTT